MKDIKRIRDVVTQFSKKSTTERKKKGKDILDRLLKKANIRTLTKRKII